MGEECADLCRKHGMSQGTFYAWKSKFFLYVRAGGQTAKALTSDSSAQTRLLQVQKSDLGGKPSLDANAKAILRQRKSQYLRCILGAQVIDRELLVYFVAIHGLGGPKNLELATAGCLNQRNPNPGKHKYSTEIYKCMPRCITKRHGFAGVEKCADNITGSASNNAPKRFYGRIC